MTEAIEPVGVWRKPWGGRRLHYFLDTGDVQRGTKSKTACGKIGLVPHSDMLGFPHHGRCPRCERAIWKMTGKLVKKARGFCGV